MGSTGGGGGNLGKMAKNCMKMTKSSFWGQNSGGYGGNKLIFWVVGAIPPPPLGENLIYHVIFQNQQLAAEDYIVIGEDGIFDTIEVIVL